MKHVDVIVLGGGPGGYPTAIRLAQKGKKVVVIERDTLGGTCLNRGCIPTKAFLANASCYQMCHSASAFGIHIDSLGFDWQSMVTRKNETVDRLRSGVQTILSSHGIEVIRGSGRLINDTTVALDSGIQMCADHIVVATGSEPKELAILPFGPKVYSSTTILDIPAIPSSLIIIGAGAIGCEFASLFATFGCAVTLIEALDRVLPLECESISRPLAHAFTQKGITLSMSSKVESASVSDTGVMVTLQSGQHIQGDAVLVAIGRTLNTSNIGLETAGVHVERGAIVVNDHMQTSSPHIWAVGDVTGKILLAHVATHQGLVAAENILGVSTKMHYDAVPSVTFTKPEVASVGLSLLDAQKQGQARAYAFPLHALGRGQASLSSEGFMQFVVMDSGRIIGAQAIGDQAGELIAQAALVIANELTLECVTQTIHAHPTFSEGWAEAALIAQGIALHLPKRPSSKKG